MQMCAGDHRMYVGMHVGRVHMGVCAGWYVARIQVWAHVEYARLHTDILEVNHTDLPSRISRVIDRDTTSLDARSFATGAYLSMNLSP